MPILVTTVIVSAALISNVAAYNNQQSYNYHWTKWTTNYQTPELHYNYEYRDRPNPSLPNGHQWEFHKQFYNVDPAGEFNNNDFQNWLQPNTFQNLNEWLLNQNQNIIPTSSPPVTESPQTQPSAQFNTIDCIRSCPVTPEYNPICGSNYVQYDNLGRLECARACGVDVTLMRKSACPLPPEIPSTLPVNPLSRPSLNPSNQPFQNPQPRPPQNPVPRPFQNPPPRPPQNSPPRQPQNPPPQPPQNPPARPFRNPPTRPPMYPPTISPQTARTTTTTLPPELDFDIRFGEPEE